MVGRLTRHDLRTHICEITHRGVTLQVDLRLWRLAERQDWLLFMFIGELEESRKTEEEGFTRILRARVEVQWMVLRCSRDQSLFEMRNCQGDAGYEGLLGRQCIYLTLFQQQQQHQQQHQRKNRNVKYYIDSYNTIRGLVTAFLRLYYTASQPLF